MEILDKVCRLTETLGIFNWYAFLFLIEGMILVVGIIIEIEWAWFNVIIINIIAVWYIPYLIEASIKYVFYLDHD